MVLMREQQKHKHWVVGVKGGRHFDSEGWKKFAIHHDLKVGDLLVFRHSGNLLFKVFVFDPQTACDSQSSLSLPSSEQRISKPEPEEEEAEAEECLIPSRRRRGLVPYCQFILTSYSAHRGIAYLPKKFMRENGLAYRSCIMSIIDQKKRSWQVWLHYRKYSGQSYIYRGWKAFQDANRLKPRDVIRLQLCNAGKHPIFICCSKLSCDDDSNDPRHSISYPTPKSRKVKVEEAAEAEAEAEVTALASGRGRGSLPHCQFTLTSYYAEKNIVYLPKKFVKEGGLEYRSCEVTLIDQKKRSWKVWLCYRKCDRQSYINRGWKAFQDANHLKPRDIIRLQLLNAGKHPVLKCCVKIVCDDDSDDLCHSISEPSPKPSKAKAEEEPAVVASRRERESLPHCHLTVTSYYAKKNIVYLPKKFVRESGLEYRSCVVTVMDQKKRSWQVWLNYKKGDGQVYIKRGWKAFQDGNGLKPRDVIRLQLLNAGKYPVFKCCRPNRGRNLA